MQNTENSLLALEKDRNNKKIIADIFRAMHTIKGSAGVYNFEKTVLLSHSFENLFDKIRDDKIEITNEIISLALKAKDIISDFIDKDNEDIVSDEDIKHYTDTIDKIIAESRQKAFAEADTDAIKSYYILFEPNVDVAARGVKVESILKDFDEFDFKIITKFTDKNRKELGKLEDYYEILVASDFDMEDLKAIFLFTPKEFSIEEVCGGNLFDGPEFSDFYDKAVKIIPESKNRLDLILNFVASKFNIEQSVDNELIEVEPESEDAHQMIFDELHDDEHNGKKTDVVGQQIEHIRVEASKLDELLSLVSELIISNSQMIESVENGDYSNIMNITDNISRFTNSIKENTLSLRLIPVKNVLSPYRRMVRDLSLKFNKRVRFLEEGFETLVDKSIIERLFTPLSHIIRNAIYHGIEMPDERIAKGKPADGLIRFIAYYSNTNVVIQIQDDGNGIDPEFIRQKAIKLGFIKSSAKLSKKECLDLIFIHGFTTSDEITDISGRGVGMDAIKTAIQELRGNVEVDSEIGLGTSLTITLPQTLSIIQTLHVSTGNMDFLLPIASIDRCVDLKKEVFDSKKGNRFMIDEEIVPYIDVRKFFKIPGESDYKTDSMIIIKHGKNKLGLIFETINGEYQAVIKHLGPFFRELDYLIGAAILGNNSIGYIIDPYKLMNKVKVNSEFH